ncbi:DUF2809 domain-containing protein [Rhizobium deserti]|uniref:DUF2809 domain-containing protein n=1 Tax=Rhizobium deserti TaxID=2547961 RepID=A0A4R5UJ42_9HYPH|nr:DUF2809 domain-containing protein [Rhizobium deserti]
MAPPCLSRTCQLRIRLFVAATLVIAVGLALRAYGYAFGLPFMVVKYGGSVLWGTMVYLLLATLLVDRRKSIIASLAAVAAIAVELLRLYHTPWLDDFRMTTPGTLLLGRVFSVFNIIAYLAGIAAAWQIDARCRRPL